MRTFLKGVFVVVYTKIAGFLQLVDRRKNERFFFNISEISVKIKKPTKY